MRAQLEAAGYEFRSLDHAFFQARGERTTVSFYRSGKLVIQGGALDGWQTRFLPDAVATPSKKAKPSSNLESTEGQDLSPGTDQMGSDEAGKGDSFGGLTVAAVAVPAERFAELKEAGVDDSKALTDKRIRILAPWIRDEFAHVERVLAPSDYNQGHAASQCNINNLLARLHAEALAELSAGTGYTLAVVDRFSPKEPVRTSLARTNPQLKVVEQVRAERFVAVAAASVLAREAFLVQMEMLREEFACDLPLGSGAPVPPAMRRFLEIHGVERLGAVAKVHFSNVQRLAAQYGSGA